MKNINPRKTALNQILDIGGMATINNMFAYKAKTPDGIFISPHRLFKEMLQEDLIRKLPTITKLRNTRQETFYTLTGKGASFVGRRDSHRSRDPKSPQNVMHESMKFDILLSLIRFYPDYVVKIIYDKSYSGLRPDATIKMTHRATGKEFHFLLELERKRNPERTLNEKLHKYEETFKVIKSEYELSKQFKVLVVYSFFYFDGFLRPQEYSEYPQVKPELELMEKQCDKLVKLSSNLSDRYRFISFNKFLHIHEPVWQTTKGDKVSLL